MSIRLTGRMFSSNNGKNNFNVYLEIRRPELLVELQHISQGPAELVECQAPVSVSILHFSGLHPTANFIYFTTQLRWTRISATE